MGGWAGVWVVLFNEVCIHVEGLVAGKSPPSLAPFLICAMLCQVCFGYMGYGVVLYGTERHRAVCMPDFAKSIQAG